MRTVAAMCLALAWAGPAAAGHGKDRMQERANQEESVRRAPENDASTRVSHGANGVTIVRRRDGETQVIHREDGNVTYQAGDPRGERGESGPNDVRSERDGRVYHGAQGDTIVTRTPDGVRVIHREDGQVTTESGDPRGERGEGGPNAEEPVADDGVPLIPRGDVVLTADGPEQSPAASDEGKDLTAEYAPAVVSPILAL